MLSSIRNRIPLIIFIYVIVGFFRFFVENIFGFPEIYFFRAVVDSIIILLLPLFFGKNKLISDLIKINSISVFVNFYGLIIWAAYVAPTSYNWLNTILVFVELARLMWISKNDDNINYSSFSHWFYKSYRHLLSSYKKVRN